MSKSKYLLLFFFPLFITVAFYILPAFAEGEDEPAEPKATLQCPDEITKVFNERTTAFGDFMQKNFLQQKPNSELIEVAIDNYRRTRSFLRNYLRNNFKPSPEFLIKMGLKTEEGNVTMVLPLEVYEECARTLEDDYFGMLDQLTFQHVKVTAAAKQTTLLTDKLNSINEKLRKTAFKVGLMQGYFGTFSNKVPCFIGKCE